MTKQSKMKKKIKAIFKIQLYCYVFLWFGFWYWQENVSQEFLILSNKHTFYVYIADNIADNIVWWISSYHMNFDILLH